MVLELPTLTDPVPMTTLKAGGGWSPNDSFGDYTFGEVTIDAVDYYLLIWHFQGGVVNRKVKDGNPYSGWPAHPTPIVQSIPRADGPSSINADTWTFVQNPITGIVTAFTAVKDGVRVLLPGTSGSINSIQRATSATATSEPGAWSRDPDEILLSPHASAPWEGPTIVSPTSYEDGTLEESVLYDPELQAFVMFYSGIHFNDPEDAWGETRRDRIGRAVAPLANFDTAPVFTRDPAPSSTSYVFDPRTHGGIGGAYTVPPGVGSPGMGTPGTAYVPLQSHVSIDWDGVYHMVMLGATPSLSQGAQNQSWAVYHYYSTDKGFTWTADSLNPIVTRARFSAYFTTETPGFTANYFNSPHLYWDFANRKVYLSLAAGPTVYQPGTKPYLMEAQFALAAGTASFTAPMPSMAASGFLGADGTASFTAPMPSMAASGQTGTDGTASFTAPMPSMAASGFLNATGTASFTAPMPTMSAFETEPPPSEDVSIVGGGTRRRQSIQPARWPGRALTEQEQAVYFHARERRKSLAGVPEMYRALRFPIPTSPVLAASFPNRSSPVTFATAIRIIDAAPSGLIFAFGDVTTSLAFWVDGDTIGVRAGSSGDDAAIATFVNAGGDLPVGLELDLVFAVRPGDGRVRLWGNGREIARAEAVNGQLPAGWAAASNGSFAGAAAGSLPAEVTAVGAPVGFVVIEPLSVYAGIPKHFV